MTDLNLMHLMVFVWGVLTIYRETIIYMVASSIANGYGAYYV